MTPTLAELQAEPLSAKNRRIVQGKCAHEEVYSSTVSSASGVFTNKICLDCGKWWHIASQEPHS